MLRFIIIIVIIGSFNCNAQQSNDSASNVFDELPDLMLNTSFSYGLYNQTLYKTKSLGVNVSFAFPVDNKLSFECYFDYLRLSDNSSADSFWTEHYSIPSRHVLTVSGTAIATGGVRCKYVFLKYLFFTFGGSFGMLSFTPVLDGITYNQSLFSISEMEAGIGFSRSLSRKFYISSGMRYKYYFITNVNSKAHNLVFDIIGIGFKFYNNKR